MLRVAFFLADGIEGHDDGAGACVKKPGINLVPGELATAVASDYDDSGHFSIDMIRVIDNGRDSHPELRAIGDSMRDDAWHRLKNCRSRAPRWAA
jgi:hypothetical protein